MRLHRESVIRSVNSCDEIHLMDFIKLVVKDDIFPNSLLSMEYHNLYSVESFQKTEAEYIKFNPLNGILMLINCP